MYRENKRKKALKNIEGLRLYQQTMLQYSLEIIKEIKENPQLLVDISDTLDIDENTFLNMLSENEPANIVIYDKALTIAKTKKLEKYNNSMYNNLKKRGV